MSDLIIAGALLLHQTPRLSIVTVGDFEHRHKLHHPEVFGPLSDDARQALCLLQIDLEKNQRQKQLSSATLLRFTINDTLRFRSPGSTRSDCCVQETRRSSSPACPVGQTEGAR